MPASKRFYAMGQRYRSMGYSQNLALRAARMENAPQWAHNYFTQGWMGY